MSNSNNPEESPSVPGSPSVNPSTPHSFSANGFLGRSFMPTDLHRGDSWSSVGSASSSASTSDVLCPEAVAAVVKAKDEMGLLNPATTAFNKLNSVDKRLVHDLILVEEQEGPGYPASTRRYTGINNTCQLSLKRHGMDLSRIVSDARNLESPIEEATNNLRDLEVAAEALRDKYHKSLNAVGHQKVTLESYSDLYDQRMKDMSRLAKKYAFTDWIKENAEPLASATVEEARFFIGLASIEQVRLLTIRACKQSLRMLKRLGWDKSDFMVGGFGGALLVKPRKETVVMLQDLLIAYLCLASKPEMEAAAQFLHKTAIQPTTAAAVAGLEVILEDVEGDDTDTLAKKRQMKEWLEEMMSPNKKRRVNS